MWDLGSLTGDWTCSYALGGKVLTTGRPGKSPWVRFQLSFASPSNIQFCIGMCCCYLVTKLYPTFCDPMDCSSLGSSVHGIFHAKILEWVAIPFPRGSSRPRNRTWVFHIAGRFFYCLSHQGSPCLLEWVAYPFSSGSSQPRDLTHTSCIAGGFFTIEPPGKPG